MKMKSRVLAALYFATLMVTLPLLWLTSPSFRADMPAPLRRRSSVLMARISARHMTRELGASVVWCMAVPAAILSGASQGSVIAGVYGAAFGLLLFSLIPVVAPLPSTIIRNDKLRGKL